MLCWYCLLMFTLRTRDMTFPILPPWQQTFRGPLVRWLLLICLAGSVAYVTLADEVNGKPVCIVYNYSVMNCTWDWAEMDYLENGIDYKMCSAFIHTKFEDRFSSCCTGDNLWPVNVTRWTCRWTYLPSTDMCPSLHLDWPFFLKPIPVTALCSNSNAFDTDLYTYNPLDVQPPGVTIKVDDAKGRHWLNVTWDPNPHEHWYFRSNANVVYSIHYRPQWSSPECSVEETALTLNKTANVGSLTAHFLWANLINLVPNTSYEITVRGIPIPQGIWSDPVSTHVYTLPDIPGAAPVLASGGFHSTPNKDNKRLRNVTLLWKSIPDCQKHGIVEYFRIRSYLLSTSGSRGPGETHDCPLVVPLPQYCTVLLNRSQTYELELDAANQGLGFNEGLDLQPVTVLLESDLPSSPELLFGVTKDMGMLVEWSPVHGASGYTVYWCRGKVLECTGELHFEPVENGTESFLVRMPGRDIGHFVFAVSAEATVDSSTVSSGMKWTLCRHDAPRAPSPKDFSFSKVQNSKSLRVEWTVQPESFRYCINMFVLTYCEQDRCDQGSPDKEARKEISAANRSYLLEGLKEETTYLLTLVADTPFGTSPPAIISKATPRDSSYAWQVALIVLGCLVGLILTAIGVMGIVSMKLHPAIPVSAIDHDQGSA